MKKADFKNPDLHIHSTFSDGTDSPRVLLENLKKSGIDIFSLTDHDGFNGCMEMAEIIDESSPCFIGGIELSCEDETGKYHILGYSYDISKESIVNAVEDSHNNRLQKVQNRIDFLKNEKGIVFSKEEIDSIFDNKNPGKPHLARLLYNRGDVATYNDGFNLLNEYQGEDKKLTPKEAILAILDAEGIPILAHGIFADGSKHLTEDEIEDRVKRLKKFGLMGLECYYSGFNDKEKNIMLSLADKYNLMVTAGSDYHGRAKTVQLGETNNPESERLERFYRAVKALIIKE